jgi:intracellular sulfur oxidation DsrE/DsrF family protein
MTRNVTSAILGVIIFLFFCQPGYGQEFNNKRALDKLAAVKAYFDVKTKNPDKLERQLMLINETLQQLAKEGVKSEFIIGFRGSASNFVTQADDYVLEEDFEAKKKIQEWVRRFRSLGVSMEQCLISATFEEIEPGDFLPEIAVVKSSYISMIAYQNKGYAQITMD